MCLRNNNLHLYSYLCINLRLKIHFFSRAKLNLFRSFLNVYYSLCDALRRFLFVFHRLVVDLLILKSAPRVEVLWILQNAYNVSIILLWRPHKTTGVYYNKALWTRTPPRNAFKVSRFTRRLCMYINLCQTERFSLNGEKHAKLAKRRTVNK